MSTGWSTTAARAAVRDHRRRDGGHPQRDQAEGRRPHRLHGLREGRSCRRDVAGEHVPGALAATSRPISTPIRSRPRPNGATDTRRATRSRPTSSRSRASTTSSGRDPFRRRGHELPVRRRSRGTSRRQRGHRDEVDVVIAATGVLHHPRFPDFDGVDDFEGAVFHSSRWDHDVKLDGARIGIVGTGSTAVQMTSALVEPRRKLSLFQRTAQWIMPRRTRPTAMTRRRRSARTRSSSPSSGRTSRRCSTPSPTRSSTPTRRRCR